MRSLANFGVLQFDQETALAQMWIVREVAIV